MNIHSLQQINKNVLDKGYILGISFAKQVFVLHMNGKTGEQIASELKVPVPEVNELLAGISNC